jgi:hypothetical protein
MTSTLRMLCLPIALATTFLAGCVVYEVPPASPPPPSTFDRAWSAAVGGLQDAGVQVTSANSATGVIQGSRDGINATVIVARQADGTVRVQLDTSGQTQRDPDLPNRFTQAYNRRMGR